MQYKHKDFKMNWKYNLNTSDFFTKSVMNSFLVVKISFTCKMNFNEDDILELCKRNYTFIKIYCNYIYFQITI